MRPLFCLNGRPAVLRKTCEESLQNLSTEVIDLYYLHRIDPGVPVEESIGELARMVEQGKIQTIGLSEISSDSLRREYRKDYHTPSLLTAVTRFNLRSGKEVETCVVLRCANTTYGARTGDTTSAIRFHRGAAIAIQMQANRIY